MRGTDLAGVEPGVEDAVLVGLVAVVVAERVQRHRAQRVHAHLLLVRLEVVLALKQESPSIERCCAIDSVHASWSNRI